MSEVLWLGDVPIVYQSVTGLELTHAWKFAEQATIQDIPRQQFIGRSGAGCRLNVKVHWMLGVDPSAVVAQLRALGDRGEVVSLQHAFDGSLLGYYVLTNMTELRKWTLPTGHVIEADLSLNLKPERAPENILDADEPLAIERYGVEYEASPGVIDIDRVPDDVTFDEILRRA